MYNQKAEEDMNEEEEDFLAELTREATAENPYFPEMVEAQLRKRRFGRALGAKRVELGLSRAKVAKRLGISAHTLESLERGESDPPLSLVMHFALILDQTIEARPAPVSEEAPSSV